MMECETTMWGIDLVMIHVNIAFGLRVHFFRISFLLSREPERYSCAKKR